jgi:hypothetical protein
MFIFTFHLRHITDRIVDFYGRGHSDTPKGPYNVALYTNQVKELVDTIGYKDKKFHLVGKYFLCDICLLV